MNIFCIGTLFSLMPVTAVQKTLPQTPPVQTVSIGSTVMLNCYTSCYTSGGVHWYKQQLQEHLQLVYIVHKHFVPDRRFSGKINDDSTIYTLVIRDVQRNDSGHYFCAARELYGEPYKVGNGSKLFITEPPAIFLLSLPLDEMFHMEANTLVCLVNNVLSDSIPIGWNISTWDGKHWTHSGTIVSAGGFAIISHFRVPTETWKQVASCTCSVQITSTEILASEVISYHREPWWTHCQLMYYWCSLMILLPLTMLAVTIWIYSKCVSGKWEKDSFTDARPRDSNQETLYAHLAFTGDSTF
ncbi:uncharacterized protein LOC125449850 [Stegostoma tigrinum]|uniref:uncharacterized protein LOC125449850 n=1 Tax=Stegostoma tigrinum TaxID=3053191 RepID=UPI00286FFCD8|nr:uncharacterized protein LOC125449850 [Stegostoma tigrinum]